MKTFTFNGRQVPYVQVGLARLVGDGPFTSIPKGWGLVRHDPTRVYAFWIAPLGVNILLRYLWKAQCWLKWCKVTKWEQDLQAAYQQGYHDGSSGANCKRYESVR